MPVTRRAGDSVPHAAPRRSSKGVAGEKRKKTPTSKNYHLRVDEATDHLIEAALAVLGQNRTEFLLTSAKVRAQEVLLNRAHFTLSSKAWDAFEEDLASPAVPTAELIALMARTQQWEN